MVVSMCTFAPGLTRSLHLGSSHAGFHNVQQFVLIWGTQCLVTVIFTRYCISIFLSAILHGQ